jgi:hypothetical protein
VKRVLILTALIIPAFTLLLYGTRIVGYATRSPGNAIVDAGNCSQPCWHGIQPGTTTLDRAQAAVLSDNRVNFVQVAPRFDNEACWETLTDPAWLACTVFLYGARTAQRIQLIHIDPPQGALRLGDAVALFGEPVAASLCWWNMNIAGMPNYFLRGRVFFKGNVEAWVYDLKQPLVRHYTPDMIVFTLRYHYPAEEPPYPFDAPHWPGFKKAVREDCA